MALESLHPNRDRDVAFADYWKAAGRTSATVSASPGARPRTVLVLAGLGAGGTEKVVHMLAHHRLRCGDQVDVVALNAPSAASFFDYGSGITLHTLGATGGGPRVLRTLTRLWRLRRLLQILRPDVTLSFLTKVNVMTAIAARGLGTALILSERNNFLIQEKHPLWLPILTLCARGTKLVMQTRQARNALPWVLQADASVIPNPIAPASSNRPLSADRTAFVAVGRLDRQKGFDLLIDAFARALPRIPSATLTIFGEGSERAVLEAQVQRLGLAGCVSLPGVARSPDDWSPGDVFVLSSRFEGFPNVLLEALAKGLPTIAFDCPWGPAEILGEAGMFPLVPVGDTEALADALVAVVEDMAWRRRMANAGPAIAAAYSAEAVFAQWDALIDALRHDLGRR